MLDSGVRRSKAAENLEVFSHKFTKVLYKAYLHASGMRYSGLSLS